MGCTLLFLPIDVVILLFVRLSMNTVPQTPFSIQAPAQATLNVRCGGSWVERKLRGRPSPPRPRPQPRKPRPPACRPVLHTSIILFPTKPRPDRQTAPDIDTQPHATLRLPAPTVLNSSKLGLHRISRAPSPRREASPGPTEPVSSSPVPACPAPALSVFSSLSDPVLGPSPRRATVVDHLTFLLPRPLSTIPLRESLPCSTTGEMRFRQSMARHFGDSVSAPRFLSSYSPGGILHSVVGKRAEDVSPPLVTPRGP